MNSFVFKWFAVYYFVLGLLSLVSGLVIIIRAERFKMNILEYTKHTSPPQKYIKALRYFLWFTLTSLVLALIPFSLFELLFTLWSLLMIYITGKILLNWPETRILINSAGSKLIFYIRLAGAVMVSLGLVIFLLDYLVIAKISRML